MKYILPVSDNGTITLPDELMRDASLKAGDTLEYQVDEEAGELILSKAVVRK